MDTLDDTLYWNVKTDAFRPINDFADLMNIVSCYYEQYSKAVTFIGPWISKQSDIMFIPPDKEQIKTALGKERPSISFRSRSAFIESIIEFISKHKGKKTLIHPSPSSHHSAQFTSGTFSISQVNDKKPVLKDGKAVRKESKILHKIEFFGADAPIYIENLKIPANQINFIILRPKLGRLGTPSASKWEVLLFKKAHGYLIEHCDSNLNPRWSGIM